ncbi:MAG TPA: tetratricopeptide repeat protein, partial [Pyrinomonadaceae bacterium]|nr:tetratricopeptide repeat protein [Pyrinomonadaceae bacterium]
MNNILRPLLKMFYNPLAALGEVRDRASLGAAGLLALLAHAGYLFYTQWGFLKGDYAVRAPLTILSTLLEAGGSILFLAVVFIPVAILVANLFERRGSFGLVLQQEYAAFASVVFYAWAAANLISLPLALFAKVSGFQETVLELSMQQAATMLPPEARTADLPRGLTENFFLLLMVPFFGLWITVGVREVFRLSWGRALGTAIICAVTMFFAAPILGPLFGGLIASPFLLVLLFLFVRGYVTEFTRTQRARASFKQNLEAATLNPADASAHYNLGLIHLQRKELGEARARFARAVEIDPEEVDSHFQLGRIAREEGRLPEAIEHFGQVVARDPAHAQQEIWR